MTDTALAPHTPPPDPMRAGEDKPARLGWALLLISVAQLVVVLDATIATIALPFIGSDLGIGSASLAWVVTGYSLAFGGLLLLGGRLGDIYGRRRIFMAGLAVFAIASLLGGLATNEGLLLGARGLQGFGAALASPAALALIATTFPAGPARNRAFAVYAAMSGVGAAVGLILGGWLTGLDSAFGIEMSGWRLTFLINVPIGLIAALLAPRFLKESESQLGKLDIPGALTGTLGLLGIVFGLTRAGEEAHGWGDQWTLVSLVSGIALLVAFVVIEARVAHPLLPIRILQNRTRAASFLVMMIIPAAMFSMFFFLSLFIQQVVGFSPLETGFAFLPFSFGVIAGSAISSNLVNRYDARFIAGTGALLGSIALFGLSRLDVNDSAGNIVSTLAAGGHLGSDVNYWASIFPFVLLLSFGMGLVWVPMTLTAVHHVRDEDTGIGSGVLNTMQQVGGALGLAILSTVSLQFTSARADDLGPQLTRLAGDSLSPEQLGYASYLGSFTDGATAAILVGSVLMLVGALVAFLFINVKHDELATSGPDGVPVHIG